MSLGEFGWSELMHLVRNHEVCSTENVVALLQNGRSSDVVSKHGVDLVCLAVASGCLNMVKVILSFVDYKEGPINPISVASFYGYSDIVQYLHELNPNLINMTAPYSGLTSLMFAAVNNKLQTVELLLSLGSNPYIKNANGETVLDMTDNKEIKKFLQAKTKLNEIKIKSIRNSPMKIRMIDQRMTKTHKFSLTLSPYSPKRLSFLSPCKLKQKTKSLICDKLKKRRSHEKLECLLQDLELEKYEKLFLEQEIDRKTLFTLSDNDLKQLGIEDANERYDIVKKILQYKH